MPWKDEVEFIDNRKDILWKGSEKVLEEFLIVFQKDNPELTEHVTHNCLFFLDHFGGFLALFGVMGLCWELLFIYDTAL